MENLTPEMIEKARAAKTPEELLALAQENGIKDFTEESAEEYFKLLHPASGEVADEELENVTGGGCHNKNGLLVVTSYTRACTDAYRCKKCRKPYRELGAFDYEGAYTTGMYTMHKCSATGYDVTNKCESCYFFHYSKGLYVCSSPLKAKH